MTENKVPGVTVDENWWDIISLAATKSAEQHPFATLVVILIAVIISTLGPFTIYRHYRLREIKSKQDHEFNSRRAEAREKMELKLLRKQQ